jgi:hypothetical protein
MDKITHTEIRMYRMGTGDCFVLKFFAGDKLNFKMMIDCGTWMGSKERLTPYVNDLKEYVDNHVDLLVITHEHKDHVHLFDVCRDLFTEIFTVDKTWMAWTENDSLKKVKKWQKDFGEKKKALAIASDRLQSSLKDPAIQTRIKGEYNGISMLGAMQSYADIVSNFSALQMDKNTATGQYKGGLEGMTVVKEIISKGNIEYYSPGDIIENLTKLVGIKFYVLGPPLTWEEVKVETGGKGESYEHNKVLTEGNAFTEAILAMTGQTSENVLPFDRHFESGNMQEPPFRSYTHPDNEWRTIDNDWLNSAGSLALRINSITNNLSLALAIEFEESGRVMLFPGDAEYGSWASWHNINWSVPSRNDDVHLTEDLLNRTIFYKVAHHLSHNGTAERLGLDMMIDKDLSAMATLDYDVISSGWKSTMPNRRILKDLVAKTKGRLMVMNLDQLFYDSGDSVTLTNKIKQERKKMNDKEKKEFTNAYVEDELYLQFTVKGKK